MLALRSRLTRALTARRLAPQVCSSFATGPRQTDGTFYEFRTYYLKPSKMNEFLENFKKNVHLRTAHSELIGYWSVEFGGRMNTVFHIWKYDNFAHRAAVRKALAKDKVWQEQFLIPNLALIDKQESEIAYLVPWCKIEKPPKNVTNFFGISSAVTTLVAISHLLLPGLANTVFFFFFFVVTSILMTDHDLPDSSELFHQGGGCHQPSGQFASAGPCTCLSKGLLFPW
ncbi:protein NipSnap homolog 3A-like isoform X3 [Castor canadensis]|uniref:Protein NipSnap homolog 3A-like isoform X3 n=1 Tax=Castor canadensis TaxID=51338 RepID=A0AC58KR98_CASCN